MHSARNATLWSPLLCGPRSRRCRKLPEGCEEQGVLSRPSQLCNSWGKEITKSALFLRFRALAEFTDETQLTTTQIFGGFGNSSWMNLTNREQWALLYAQNCALFVWVVLMVAISASFLHRTESLRRRPPHHNRVWVITSIGCIALQAIFMTVSLAPQGVYSLSVLRWWAYVIALAAAPAVILAVQEVIKVHDRREWEKFQKRSKLEFNTKLWVGFFLDGVLSCCY
ncbi:hypothetical protein DFJ77DRAFT_431109 [Powellomyces hirtus]|nr:hypothetical protein DFJ77DRAFT_431109 [Powellomyces hirtus]